MNLHFRISAWLELLRFPNLFTASGEVFAGCALASGHPLSDESILAAASVLCLYAYGLVLNDIADSAVDANDRPERPIPSGRVSKGAAIMAASLFLTLALGLAAWSSLNVLAATVILAVIASAYDIVLKRGWAGPHAMAFCRVVSLWVGWAAAGAKPEAVIVLVVASTVWYAYLIGVCLAAKDETIGRRMSAFPALIPSIAVAAWIPCALILLPTPALEAFTFAVAAAGLAILTALLAAVAWIRAKSPNDVQKAVGAAIGNLLLLQASTCAISGQLGVALCLAVMILPMRVAVQFFKST